MRFTNQKEAWAHVINAAGALMEHVRGHHALAKTSQQIAAIKAAAIRRQAIDEANGLTAAMDAINEIAAIRAYIAERYSLARRQERLMRLQTRRLLDTERDDQKQEIARGPFMDAVRAEEEGSEDEDKDR
jgi:hypothetical protein